MSEQNEKQYDVFVSYSQQDKKAASDIVELLEQRGLVCWIAPRDVNPSKDYPSEIIRGIKNSKSFVLVMSEAANQSEFVLREVERAVNYKKPIFPLRMEDVPYSPSLEILVSSIQWIDAWQGSLLDHVELVVSRLQNLRDDIISLSPNQSPLDKFLRFFQRNTVATIAVLSILLIGILAIIVASKKPVGQPAVANHPDIEVVEGLDEVTEAHFKLDGIVQFVATDASRAEYYINVVYSESAMYSNLPVLLEKANFAMALEEGDPVASGVGVWGAQFRGKLAEPPEYVRLFITNEEGDSVGPLDIPATRIKEKFTQALQTHQARMAQQTQKALDKQNENVESALARLQGERGFRCRYIWSGRIANCSFDLGYKGDKLLEFMRIGPKALQLNQQLGVPSSDSSVVQKKDDEFLFIPWSTSLFYQATFINGTQSPTGEVVLENPPDVEESTILNSLIEGAPRLFLRSTGGGVNRLSSLQMAMLPYPEIASIELLTDTQGASFKRHSNGYFYLNDQQDLFQFERAQSDNVNYPFLVRVNLVDGQQKSYEYHLNRDRWRQEVFVARHQKELANQLRCQSDFKLLSEYSEFKIAACSLSREFSLIKSIHWGTQADELSQTIQYDEVRSSLNQVELIDHGIKKIPAYLTQKIDEYEQNNSQKRRYEQMLAQFEKDNYALFRGLVANRLDYQVKRGLFWLGVEDPRYLFFRVEYLTGAQSPVLRVQFR